MAPVLLFLLDVADAYATIILHHQVESFSIIQWVVDDYCSMENVGILVFRLDNVYTLPIFNTLAMY